MNASLKFFLASVLIALITGSFIAAVAIMNTGIWIFAAAVLLFSAVLIVAIQPPSREAPHGRDAGTSGCSSGDGGLTLGLAASSSSSDSSCGSSCGGGCSS